MADSIQMRVTRYTPSPGAVPTVANYDVPLRQDWSILDGLNFVKDHIDGSLSFRWSCRMGICGSCGMNVEGEPKLTCATFLTDYAPGPVRVEPLTNFPVVRDLVVDIDDFMEKLPRVKPWIIRDDEKSVMDGEYLQTPEELEEYKQFSNCINCMLCYAACPIYGLDESFIGPAAIALAERYDLDSRDRGQRERLDILIEKEGVWGCTFVGECTRVCPKHVDPQVPSSDTSSRPRLRTSRRSCCHVVRDERADNLPAARIQAVVDEEAQLLHVRAAGAQQRLRRLVRGVSMIMVFAIGRGEASYQNFMSWAASPVVVVINIVALAFAILHTVTWFALTPQAMVVRFGGRQVPAMKEVRVAGRYVPAATVVRVGGRVPAGLVVASQWAGLVVVSAFVAWLVLR
jgi:fumarate reductase iron-sulfur subunit